MSKFKNSESENKKNKTHLCQKALPGGKSTCAFKTHSAWAPELVLCVIVSRTKTVAKTSNPKNDVPCIFKTSHDG